MPSIAFEGAVALVGGGNMGGAMLDGWLDAGLAGDRVRVIDPGLPDSKRARWGERGVRFEEDDTPPALLMIAVKPQIVEEVLASAAAIVGPQTLVASVAAGVKLARMEAAFGDQQPCLRAMPNTPAQIGRGVSVCCANDHVTTAQRGHADALLRAIGAVEWIEDEGAMDAVTAVSGSGPAYVFHLTEALAAAGIAAGLPRELAERLALHTVGGAGELMHRSDMPPGRLREAVTSPNGTTEAGLAVLMPELTKLMSRTVAAAKERSRELG